MSSQSSQPQLLTTVNLAYNLNITNMLTMPMHIPSPICAAGAQDWGCSKLGVTFGGGAARGRSARASRFNPSVFIMICLLIRSHGWGCKVGGIIGEYRRHQMGYSTCKLEARGKSVQWGHPDVDAKTASDIRMTTWDRMKPIPKKMLVMCISFLTGEGFFRTAYKGL